MRILLAGGGSGGHVTPLRAISQSLQKQQEKLEITVVTDRIFYQQTKFLFQAEPDIKLKRVFSGKFRRYNGKSFIWHIVHLPTLLKNIRDIFLIGVGIIQSIHYFVWHKPDVVFCKGGFVCVPVGIAARLFQVPLIIHDSDTHPGLTNRFLSRWATKIGTGMPTKYYQYEQSKMVYSGIPVDSQMTPVVKTKKLEAMKKLGLHADRPVLFVTGGGTGAKELNITMCAVASELIKAGWQILHLTGKNKAVGVYSARDKLSQNLQEHWHIAEFAEILPYVQAADVIVSRAGATAMQEFANARKTVILVPSPYLTGGHQLKNAAMFVENGAALVLQESELSSDPMLLLQLIQKAFEPQVNKKLANELHERFAKPHAADELAQLILSTTTSS